MLRVGINALTFSDNPGILVYRVINPHIGQNERRENYATYL